MKRKEAKRVAETEGVAVAEKLSALRNGVLIQERAARGNVAAAKRILRRAGKGNTPAAGDEID